MQKADRSRRGVAAAAGLAFASGLAVACAGVEPPTGTLAQAELAVRAADQATATQHAPLELYQAQEKLEQAREAMEDEEYLEARRLAELALVQAQVAEERAQTARARETAQELQESIATLRTEAERTTRARQQTLGIYERDADGTGEPGTGGTPR